MLILHYAFEEETLLLWVETKLRVVQKIPRSRGRSSNSPPSSHPYAADAEGLTNALKDRFLLKRNFTKALNWR